MIKIASGKKSKKKKWFKRMFFFLGQVEAVAVDLE
jgi:hypothetical protein